MNDVLVARLWMLGVVVMMCIFGLAALVGYFRMKHRSAKSEPAEDLDHK